MVRFRNRVFSFSYLLLVAAQPTTQPSSQPVAAADQIKLSEFTSDEFRFRLKYPSDWTMLDRPVNNQVFSLQTQPVHAADKNLGVVGLRIDAGPDDAPDGQILKDVSDEIVAYLFNHGGKKITIKPDKLGVYTSRRVRFVTEHPTGNTEAMYIIAVHKRTEYVFTIAAPTGEFDKMLSKVEKLLKSFEVLE